MGEVIKEKKTKLEREFKREKNDSRRRTKNKHLQTMTKGRPQRPAANTRNTKGSPRAHTIKNVE